MPFRLRAAASVEKCSWECFREGTKFRSVDVPLLNGLVVLDQWERVVEMVEECAPFLVLLGLSESDRVVV